MVDSSKNYIVSVHKVQQKKTGLSHSAIMTLPKLIPVRKTRWVELNYRSSRRYCEESVDEMMEEEAKEPEQEHPRNSD